MKILCSSGGTAGHVYPALSILHSFRTLCRHQGIGVELEWLGRGGSMSRKLVEAAGIRHRQVSSGQIRSVNPLIQALSLIRVGFGTLQALWWVARFRPHCCLATGSNAAAPGAFAAYLLRIPLLYFMPDASPGLTDRLLIRVACKVLVGHEGALPHTRGKGVVTGYPLRASLLEAVKDRTRARRTLAQAWGPEFLSAAHADGAQSHAPESPAGRQAPPSQLVDEGRLPGAAHAHHRRRLAGQAYAPENPPPRSGRRRNPRRPGDLLRQCFA